LQELPPWLGTLKVRSTRHTTRASCAFGGTRLILWLLPETHESIWDTGRRSRGAQGRGPTPHRYRRRGRGIDSGRSMGSTGCPDSGLPTKMGASPPWEVQNNCRAPAPLTRSIAGANRAGRARPTRHSHTRAGSVTSPVLARGRPHHCGARQPQWK